MGSAFCNRVSERGTLARNISNITHTVIMAPRRYGKSSLIRQVLTENHCDYVWIDFLSVTSKEDAEIKIVKGINQLLFKLSPDLKKFQKQASEFVKSMTPEVNLGWMGQSLTLHMNGQPGAQESLEDVLLRLDDYAQKVGKKAVLVFDEFQQLNEIKDNLSVEAMIRHAVERSQAVTYIFSGSNRHLLHEMFGQSNRPLYRLCQAMTIERITAEDYVPFLKKLGKAQWGIVLDPEIIERIFFYSEFHPFYLNALCEILWGNEEAPVLKDVDTAWDWYITNHKSDIVSEIINLPINQKKIIQTLAKSANSPVTEPYGADFSHRTKISVSSLRQAVEALMAKDILYKNAKGELSLLDPAVLYYFRNF